MKYMSINDVVNSEKYPFKLGQIRHMLTIRHKNGLSKAVIKIGKRLYIREDLFDIWIDSHFKESGGDVNDC